MELDCNTGKLASTLSYFQILIQHSLKLPFNLAKRSVVKTVETIP